MSQPEREPLELTYPLRTAARLTGLSPELLRAWERRYGAVEPLRTPGGTRRYRAADLERLRMLKAAVDAGNRISEVADLDRHELRDRAVTPEPAPKQHLEDILTALDDLEGPETQRLLALQLSALGAVRFAREIAAPLAREIGARWADDRFGIASEHLGTSVLRAMLGSALIPAAAALRGPRIVFATLSGERHELGLQIAALTAMGAGANPVYLGTELPVEDILSAVERTGARAVALSMVSESERLGIAAIRNGLPRQVGVWVGGAGLEGVELPDGVERIEDLDDIEPRVALLAPDAGGAG